MNTRITYGYRDGANYKQAGSFILTGIHTPDQAERLRRACMQEDDNAFFVPEAVDLITLTGPNWDDEIDHGMHTLGTIEHTNEEPTDPRNMHDLLAAFCGRDWEEHNNQFCISRRTSAKA